MISDAFSGDLRQDFYKFIEQAKAYRDQQGAHFDQQSFYVKHGDKQPGEDGLIYHVGWSSALLIFDWDFIAETIPQFNRSLNAYIKKLQQQVNIR
ncbi:hypothetical protein P3568_22730 [Vibrio parahaemolyticus]|uniref:hypothetical protein n=1 Tax=Vibrio parahaemolyticus TaxID=670 RepID=UPI001B80ED46|nr:hypothetical protein [Vibrio parahaemolyticus]MDF4946695.1 hypothetical protein [Vibrio parahaemolyticus]MDG2565590.1 hypothetical protein [Vibrio parahaemolyticus]MDG2614379.1 hypothetical protein [Vibrio parahaemolyticus]MDV5082628.1 hypothetical protein [Vibrio parahaemolyticus]WCM66643.1 hypothetical protein K0819_06690 [Vibrio parahaemolyticus]